MMFINEARNNLVPPLAPWSCVRKLGWNYSCFWLRILEKVWEICSSLSFGKVSRISLWFSFGFLWQKGLKFNLNWITYKKSWGQIYLQFDQIFSFSFSSSIYRCFRLRFLVLLCLRQCKLFFSEVAYIFVVSHNMKNKLCETTRT